MNVNCTRLSEGLRGLRLSVKGYKDGPSGFRRFLKVSYARAIMLKSHEVET